MMKNNILSFEEEARKVVKKRINDNLVKIRHLMIEVSELADSREGLLKKFGTTTEQFNQNLSDDYENLAKLTFCIDGMDEEGLINLFGVISYEIALLEVEKEQFLTFRK